MRDLSPDEIRDRKARDKWGQEQINRELVRFGVANAMEAAEWLRRESGDRLHVLVTPFFCGDTDVGPAVAISAHSFVEEGVEDPDRKDYDNYIDFGVGTPPSQIRHTAAWMLADWRTNTGRPA